MKLRINKDSYCTPDDPVDNWRDLLGKNSVEAERLICRKEWEYCLKSENNGYGVHKCVEYRNVGRRVTLIIDDKGIICDVFVFSIDVTPAT